MGKKTFVGVRDVDEKALQDFKVAALRERMKLGVALSIAMNDFAEKKLRGPKLNLKKLLDIKPIRVGNKKVRWSEEIDEILYGWKK
ncbi:hypothetical protein CMI48_02150 [Candidatus Pacearchaeota archaeon]|nr:hypothetical protein [Candidatus Pacearchaeota archaeon]|tara:strand:- start:64 stop:321 length:258 start_codon:yes stop_codon:yes gene_type:complete